MRRFWLAPGVLTPDAWSGLLMPSVDRVGRHFPFTLAAPLRAGQDHLVGRVGQRTTGSTPPMPSRARCSIRAFDVDALEQAIAALTAAAGERRIEELAGTRVAQQPHAQHARLGCVWWCEGASDAAAYIGAAALPRGAAFMALLREGG